MQGNEKELAQDDLNLSTYVQDKSLTGALRQVIDADTHIEGLNAQLVERLEHYQENYARLQAKIPVLVKTLKSKKTEEGRSLYISRINAHKKQLVMTENHIIKLKKYLEDLVAGSAQFKDKKNEFFQNVEDKRAENWLSDEQLSQRASINDQAEFDELVNEIDEKAKELEEIENQNYKINPAALKEYEELGIFRELDRILGTVSQHGSLVESQQPDYWPDSGTLYEAKLI